MTDNTGSDNSQKKLSDVLLELKAEYVRRLPKHIEVLKKLTTEHNWNLLAEEYHKLKGTGKTYGFPDVSTICEKLETIAQAKEGQIPQLFTQAIQLLERMHIAYKNQINFELSEDPTAITILKLKVLK